MKEEGQRRQQRCNNSDETRSTTKRDRRGRDRQRNTETGENANESFGHFACPVRFLPVLARHNVRLRRARIQAPRPAARTAASFSLFAPSPPHLSPPLPLPSPTATMFTDENDDDMMLLGSPCVTPGRPTRALAASCTSTTMAFGLSCPTPPDDGMSPLGTDDTSPYKEPLPRLLVRPATRDTSAPPLRERGNNRHEMIEQFRQQRMRSIGGSFGSLPSPTVALPSTLQDEFCLADEDSRVPSRRHPLVAKRTKTHLGQQAQQVR